MLRYGWCVGIVLAGLCGVAPHASAESPPMTVGFAETDITPEIGME